MSFLSARKRAGLTQHEVALSLGISDASVCQWETGKTLPRTQLLPQIAALYNCSIDELLAPPKNEPSNDKPD